MVTAKNAFDVQRPVYVVVPLIGRLDVDSLEDWSIEHRFLAIETIRTAWIRSSKFSTVQIGALKPLVYHTVVRILFSDHDNKGQDLVEWCDLMITHFSPKVKPLSPSPRLKPTASPK
jgi:hypothetical protein